MKNEAFSSGKEIFQNTLFLSDKIALFPCVFPASIFHKVNDETPIYNLEFPWDFST